MATRTLQPTANETPDTGQGGAAVTGNTNTGHGATTSSQVGAGATSKTCRWSGIGAAPAGSVISITLKADWTENGSITGAGTNLFRIQYSTNGGGAWNTLISHSNVTSASGPTTATQALSTSQDLTQVQVRDLIQAAASGGGDSASITGTVANILVEVVLVDGNILVMM
mgnify:CR=1 FL=1